MKANSRVSFKVCTESDLSKGVCSITPCSDDLGGTLFLNLKYMYYEATISLSEKNMGSADHIRMCSLILIYTECLQKPLVSSTVRKELTILKKAVENKTLSLVRYYLSVPH